MAQIQQYNQFQCIPTLEIHSNQQNQYQRAHYSKDMTYNHKEEQVSQSSDLDQYLKSQYLSIYNQNERINQIRKQYQQKQKEKQRLRQNNQFYDEISESSILSNKLLNNLCNKLDRFQSNILNHNKKQLQSCKQKRANRATKEENPAQIIEQKMKQFQAIVEKLNSSNSLSGKTSQTTQSHVLDRFNMQQRIMFMKNQTWKNLSNIKKSSQQLEIKQKQLDQKVKQNQLLKQEISQKQKSLQEIVLQRKANLHWMNMDNDNDEASLKNQL